MTQPWEHVTRGGKILVSGDCGRYNEHKRERLDFALSDMLQVNRFKYDNKFVHAQHGAGQCATLPVAGASDVPINMKGCHE